MADKYDDKIQHGIDDDPNNDPEKARNIGGVGGAITGAVAGSAAGPLGTVAGAVVGGVVGGIASKAAVKEVDKHDNDNTLTGIGHGATTDVEDQAANVTHGHVGNGVPGVQTGGHALDGTPDTRGVTEKAADTLTGDKYDDKTGKRID
jgi:phage tail tape-measure protein